MGSRGKSICRKVGCNNLIDSPGYCDNHNILSNPFKQLDSKKTPQTKRFYSSRKWTLKSKEIRLLNPLCNECKQNGIIKQSELVHHEPPLEELLKNGLDPLNNIYLIAICNNCHQKHLRAKRN